MARPDLGVLAPVLSSKDCAWDAQGNLVTAALRGTADPAVATSLLGNPAWKTVRAIRMPDRLKDRYGHAPALEALAFRNPALPTLERATMLRLGGLQALLKSGHRPRVLGIAWMDALWQVLDEVLAMTSPPVELEIDNPYYDDKRDWERTQWERFWSSTLVSSLERITIRLVNVGAAHWQTFRDHEIPRVVVTLDEHELVWTHPPPAIAVPAIPIPKAKAARAKSELSLRYLEQELAKVPRGIAINRA